MVELMGPVTRESLKHILEDNGFDQNAYSLSGGHPPETYVLDHRGSGWVVYYSERGLETELAAFPSEAWHVAT